MQPEHKLILEAEKSRSAIVAQADEEKKSQAMIWGDAVDEKRCIWNEERSSVENDME